MLLMLLPLLVVSGSAFVILWMLLCGVFGFKCH
jgi:hypothetical protein